MKTLNLNSIVYLIGVLAASTSLVLGDLSFTDITLSSGLQGAGAPNPGEHGIAWGDVTLDGRPDIYVPITTAKDQGTEPDLFFRNLGNNIFVEEAKLRGIDDVDGGSHGGIWADLDNDGDFDLVNATTREKKWTQPHPHKYPGHNNIYRNDGNGFFSDVTPSSIKKIKQGSRGLNAFDMDKDGDLDLFFVNGHAGSRGEVNPDKNEVYRNDGNYMFTAFTSGVAVTCPAGQGSIDTDWDMDGDMDLIACNRSGILNMLRNNGGVNNFSLVKPSSIGIDDTHRGGDGVTSADIDNDNDIDLLLVARPIKGPDRKWRKAHLYKNDGDGTFTYQRTFTGLDGFMGSFVDLDNDGDLDLLLAGEKVCYLNDGSGRFSIGPEISIEGINDPRSVACADIDNDGDMDFIYSARESRNFLYRNDYDGCNKWLKVKLTAKNGQAGAFGSKVKIYAAGQAGARLLGFREAKSCYGYMAQDDPILHFGLGSHSLVDLMVEFLDGTKMVVKNVCANQTVAVSGHSGHDGRVK